MLLPVYSSVSIMTNLLWGRLHKIQDSVPSGGRHLSSNCHIHSGSGNHPLTQSEQRLLTAWVRWLGHEAAPLPQSGTKVMKEWN